MTNNENKRMKNLQAGRYCTIVDILMSSKYALSYKEIVVQLHNRNDTDATYKCVYNLMGQISCDYPVCEKKRGKEDVFYFEKATRYNYMRERLTNVYLNYFSKKNIQQLFTILDALNGDADIDEKLEKIMRVLEG